jgi:hypothetical protein
MTTVTIEQAQARLPELIQNLAAGEEVVITRNEQPVAQAKVENMAIASADKALEPYGAQRIW